MAISPQVPICPKCPLAPKLIGPKMPICPKLPIFSNAHLSQSSHAHLSQTPICPKCSFAPIAQCPFALVFIFPASHFPPTPICHQLPSIAPMFISPKVPICFINANVNRSQSAHLLHSAHLPHKCPFVLVLIFSGAHFPPMLICPQCPLAPMSIGPNVPICSTVPIFSGAHVFWCPFIPSAHLPPMPT